MTDIEIECVASIGLAAIVWYCVSPEERESVISIDRAAKEWTARQTNLSLYYSAMASGAQMGLHQSPNIYGNIYGNPFNLQQQGPLLGLFGGLGL